MRYKYFAYMAAVAMASVTFGCKTTEANYKAAYEKTVEKMNADLDSTQIAAIDKEKEVPLKTAEDGVMLPMKTEFVKVTPDLGATNEMLKRYSIVVASFRQLFNAKSMRERITDAGYTRALVANDTNSNYYVIAFSSDSAKEVEAELARVKGDEMFNFKNPFPWVLRRY